MNGQDFEHIRQWFDERPEVTSILAAVCDVNGVPRGKRIPVQHIDKILNGDLKLPYSALFTDIWGRDIEDSPFVLDTGDGDGVLLPTRSLPFANIWDDGTSCFFPVWMFHGSGEPYEVDPRQVLAKVLRQYAELDLAPVCATELEFYLTAREDGESRPKRVDANDLLSIDVLDQHKHFLDDLYAACEAASIQADSAISESGAGQFEVNFLHREDVLRAADDAVQFKYIAKAVARKHGFNASFMAKPFGDQSGNGLHVHFSLLDTNSGKNVFANGTDEGSNKLKFAVGGMIDALPHSFLVFAPHANSYRRLREGTHAPISVTWGYDNRTTAIRIPSSGDKARRIEHRVSGADANPYLCIAAILGGALQGLQSEIAPPEPITGNAYDAEAPRFPETWQSAITNFGNRDVELPFFPDSIRQIFASCKKQECQTFMERIPTQEYKTYLSVV